MGVQRMADGDTQYLFLWHAHPRMPAPWVHQDKDTSLTEVTQKLVPLAFPLSISLVLQIRYLRLFLDTSLSLRCVPWISPPKSPWDQVPSFYLGANSLLQVTFVSEKPRILLLSHLCCCSWRLLGFALGKHLTVSTALLSGWTLMCLTLPCRLLSASCWPITDSRD